MSDPISIPVDLTNPGQFFACCGLLELADRLWPGTDGWFQNSDLFLIRNEGLESLTLVELCSTIRTVDFSSLLPPEDLAALVAFTERKSALKRQGKSLPKDDEKQRKHLNSKRIASGFSLGSPFGIRIDWWLNKDCDGDHLKTWAGQQAIGSISQAIHESLGPISETTLLEHETLIKRNGEFLAPLSFDSGRVGTAQDIGYSSDKIGQPISCCVWTEFLTLNALQRFALRPDSCDFLTYHAWCEPLPPSVAAVAARGLLPHLVGCQGRFRLAGRDSGDRYKAFQQATLNKWRS